MQLARIIVDPPAHSAQEVIVRLWIRVNMLTVRTYGKFLELAPLSQFIQCVVHSSKGQ